MKLVYLLTYNKLNLFSEKGEKVDLVKMKEIVRQVSYTSTTQWLKKKNKYPGK